MTPDPNSPAFISHEIPDSASETAIKIKDIAELLRVNLSAFVWLGADENNLMLTYNTYTGDAGIEVCFTDTNNHSHHFFVKSMGLTRTQVVCEYLFEGSINADVASFRSYAEWLMLQLWQFEIGAELCKCGKGLIVHTEIDSAYNVVSKMLDIVTNNIKPIDWFLSEEPVWQFYRTYYDLCKMLPLLQEEASKERWKNVKPENFRLIRTVDCALICLDYTDNRNYTMQFRVGMKKGGFAAERTDKFMDMFYEFENHSQNEEAQKYFEKENREFSNIANAILEIPFSWKALLFHSDDGFYISTYRENALQKYCLMLDLILPFKDKYEVTDVFIDPEILEKKKELEKVFSTEFEISNEQETNLIFSHGHFIETPIEENLSDDCPF